MLPIYSQNLLQMELAACSCYGVHLMWTKSKTRYFRSLTSHLDITRSSSLKFTSKQNTGLWHVTVYLPGERTITSWFWQSFAAGVSKETVPKVVSGGDGQCLLVKQGTGGGKGAIKKKVKSYLRFWMMAECWRMTHLHITPWETAVALQSHCLLKRST